MATRIVDISGQARSARRAGKMDAVQGIVVHHTAGTTVQSAMNALNKRGLGAQFIVDRDGTIYKSFPDGLSAIHMREPGNRYRTDAGKMSAAFGNKNLIGIEVVGLDDSKITPAQVEATKLLTNQLSQQYGFPMTNVWGHGELQSNKQSTEGATIVAAIRGEPPPPPGEKPYARDPFGVAASKERPATAQSAIADLLDPGGGTQVPEPPTAAMGFAPTIPGGGFDAAPPVPTQVASAPPMPQPPPQWAQAGGFPMDEALTGRSAQDVLMGGPRMDPRRAPPGTGPMPPNMGAMRSPADVLAAGPNLRPGGAPDASMVPNPGISPMRPAVGGPNDRRPQPPNPPPRAQGIPDPRIRPDPASLPQRGFPAAYGEQPGPPAPLTDADRQRILSDLADFRQRDRQTMIAGMPDIPRPAFQSRIAGRPEFPGAIQPPRNDIPELPPPSEPRVPASTALTPALMDRLRQAQGIGPFPSRPEFPGALPAAPNPYDDPSRQFDIPDPFTLMADSQPPPAPTPPPAAPGMITDLQGSFNRQQGRPEPGMTAQDGINQVFGAPPAPAAVPNLAIPFAEVPRPPGIDSPLYSPTPIAETPVLPSPAPARSPASWAEGLDTYVPNRFQRSEFAGGTVVPAPPQPGQPGVVQGEMPTPAGAMDIRPPVQGGPGLPPAPAALPQPAAPTPAPRQTNPGAERQRNGMIGRVLGGLLGGPLGALGGGLLGGGSGGFGFGGQPSFAWSGGGNAAYGNNGGTTTYQKGTSNALGGSDALSWQGSKGQTVTVVQDPWTGTYYGPTSTSMSAGGLY